MEFAEVVRRRHMVRRFTGEPVPAESLDRILRNAVRGPSAGFSRARPSWSSPGEDLSDSGRRGRGGGRPATTLRWSSCPCPAKQVYLDRYARAGQGLDDRDEARWPVPFWHIDTGMAALLILLTVVDEGLGALYFGIVPRRWGGSATAFGVPDDHEPIGAIAIGHDAEPAPRDLRPAAGPARYVIHFGAW